MVSNQLAVVLSTLAFLGSGGLLFLLVLVGGWGMLRGNRRLARTAGLGAAGLTGAYGLTLFAVALMSHDAIVPAGGEKYFCEIDCHLACSVTGLRPAEGVPGAEGRVWAVVLRTRFDETTISPRRGREAPLWPSPRHVALRDTAGRFHEPMPHAEEWLGREQLRSAPLAQTLRPGESYTTTLLFDLPEGAVPAQLLVEDIEWPGRLLIGDERSPWHGKVLLPVPSAAT